MHRHECGGACAFATVGDYLRFGQMLLNGGELDGQRVLGPKTVHHMISNHLGPEIKNNVANVEPHRGGFGFGLGVAVRTSEGLSSVPGNPGEFIWSAQCRPSHSMQHLDSKTWRSCMAAPPPGGRRTWNHGSSGAIGLGPTPSGVKDIRWSTWKA